MILADAVDVIFRSDSPPLIIRGSDTVLRLRPSRHGVAVTPTACACTITDAQGREVAVLTATNANGVSSVTVLGTTTAALDAGDGWRATWSVTLPSETVPRKHVEATSLVLRYLYPVIDDSDLWKRVASLDPSRKDCITSLLSYETYRVDAWAIINNKLIALQERPWLILTPEALREAHLCLTLAMIFADLRTTLNAAYAEDAKDYRQQYTDAWNGLRLLTELPSASGTTTNSPDRKSLAKPIFLGGH